MNYLSSKFQTFREMMKNRISSLILLTFVTFIPFHFFSLATSDFVFGAIIAFVVGELILSTIITIEDRNVKLAGFHTFSSKGHAHIGFYIGLILSTAIGAFVATNLNTVVNNLIVGNIFYELGISLAFSSVVLIILELKSWKGGTK